MNLHKYCTTEKFNYNPFVLSAFRLDILSNFYSEELKQKSAIAVTNPIVCY